MKDRCPDCGNDDLKPYLTGWICDKGSVAFGPRRSIIEDHEKNERNNKTSKRDKKHRTR